MSYVDELKHGLLRARKYARTWPRWVPRTLSVDLCYWLVGNVFLLLTVHMIFCSSYSLNWWSFYTMGCRKLLLLNAGMC